MTYNSIRSTVYSVAFPHQFLAIEVLHDIDMLGVMNQLLLSIPRDLQTRYTLIIGYVRHLR